MDKLFVIIIAIALTAISPILSFDSYAEEKVGKDSNVSESLQITRDKISEMASTRSAQSTGLSSLSNQVIKVDDGGNIQVYVHCNEVSDSNLQDLIDLGLNVEIVNEDLKMVQGWIPSANLEDAGDLGFVDRITPPDYAHTRVGSVTSEGDAAMMADVARAMFGVDGTGVKILVISDSVETIPMSQATGDLPIPVNVGDPGADTGIDEGTAMLEIVHDTAPGAELFFHTGFPSSLAFIDAIDYGIANNVDIIVDDLGFLTQPYFQDGSLAQKYEEASALGILTVSAAGNDATKHYQALYVSDGAFLPGEELHNFGAAAGQADEVGMTFIIPAFGTFVAFLQWSDPFGASSNDFDMVLRDSFDFEILATSVLPQDGNDDPFEFIVFDNVSASSRSVDLEIPLFSGTPQTLEIHFNGNEIITEFNVPEDSTYGHPVAPNTIGCAAFEHDTPFTIESFSSQGPASLINPTDAVLASATTRVPISTQRNKPDVAGPDGVSTTVGGFETFFGTSAAAPGVAAVAALVKEAMNDQVVVAGADPSVGTRNVQALRDALLNTAVDILGPGFDFRSGNGRIDAVAAVQSVTNGMPTDPPPTDPPPTDPPPTDPPPTDPPPTTTPPTTAPPTNGGDDDDKSSSSTGCAIASGPAQLGTAVANILIPLVPVAFAFALRARRKKNK